MIAVYIIFFFVCLFGGFGVYLLLLQWYLANEVAQYQGRKVFLLLSYLLALPLFYASVYLMLAFASKIYPIFSGGHILSFASNEISNTTTNLAFVFAALLSGLLSVIFWGWVLPKKKKA